jgi:tetratricopeptide (TPR) repeat protein
MLVTLPCVLLLLDHWPLQRLFNIPEISAKKNKTLSTWLKSINLPVLWEKIPLFVIAATSCVITFIIQQKGGAVRSLDIVPIACRITNALVSYMLYIIKMIWPAGLAIFYPHFGKLLVAPAIAAAAALILISVTVFYLRRFRYLTVGWLWYLGTLIPVIGLVQVGRQSMADRYSYIPFIGLFIMFVWGIADLLARYRYRTIILTTASCLLIAAMSICTWVQVAYWRDSIKLFSHAIKVTTDNPVAYECLAQNLGDIGRDDEAIQYYRKALQLNENEYEVHNNLGNLLRNANEKALAVEHYKKAIALTENMDIEHNGKPGFFEAHCNLALVLQELGDDKQAVEHFARALEIRQADAHAYYQYAKSLIELGKYDQAIELCEKAIQSDPKCSRAYYNMGIASFRLGNTDQAIELFKKVLQLHPKDAQMHYNIGVLFEKQGDIDQAIHHYKLSLTYDPDFQKSQDALKRILPKQNKTPTN